MWSWTLGFSWAAENGRVEEGAGAGPAPPAATIIPEGPTHNTKLRRCLRLCETHFPHLSSGPHTPITFGALVVQMGSGEERGLMKR